MVENRILITALGIVTTSAVISELRRNIADTYIFGGDINEKCNIATSKDVDEFYVFPSVVEDREEYYTFLKNFCLVHKIGTVYCFVDEEVDLLSRHREELAELEIAVCIPDNQTIQTCHYKNLFSDWIEANIPEIAIKRYLRQGDIDEYPIFVKPLEGRASIGCQELKNKKECDNFFAFNKFEDFIVQEKINGIVYAVDVVRNRHHGQYYECQRIEHLRNTSGCGIAVEIVNDSMLSDICRKIADLLDINGVVNMEFFKSDGCFYIIEINPRLPAGTSYSCMAGADTVMNALRIAKGEACVIPQIKIGKHYSRRYETYET